MSRYLCRSVDVVRVRLCLRRDDQFPVLHGRVVPRVPLGLAVPEAADALVTPIALTFPTAQGRDQGNERARKHRGRRQQGGRGRGTIRQFTPYHTPCKPRFGEEMIKETKEKETPPYEQHFKS